jgi:hypothetical protein
MRHVISKVLLFKPVIILLFIAAALIFLSIMIVTQKDPIVVQASQTPGQVSQNSAPPYPPSPVILDIDWAPANTIERKAHDSDTWPMTWADDDHLYTAYADGRGFLPRVPSKLSLGFARVEGPPTNFHGFNISPSDGERTGDGRRGEKASGMLMVDGVLYMWVRNANRAGQFCRLAFSTNYGVNWTWNDDWGFEELGFCTFLNYGKNYAGARDNYVYMVSHNGDDAYVPADDFVLTRVPKDKIMERAEYEFFVDLGCNNNPIWSANIDDRGSVFNHSGRALRSSMSYNAAIGRYIWWQHDPTTGGQGGFDTRFEGGFGIYDAPEPWGPWTTVYYTEKWDVGPGEQGHFPTKWMSADGRTMYLVFSGDDYFSVRQATLTVAEVPSSPVIESPDEEALAIKEQKLKLVSRTVVAACLFLPLVQGP